jgi:septin family protein
MQRGDSIDDENVSRAIVQVTAARYSELLGEQQRRSRSFRRNKPDTDISVLVFRTVSATWHEVAIESA